MCEWERERCSFSLLFLCVQSLAILSVVMVWWKRESSVTVATKTSVKTTVALVQIQGMAKSANLDPAKSAGKILWWTVDCGISEHRTQLWTGQHLFDFWLHGFHCFYAVPAKAHVAQENVLSRPIMRCADQILSVPMRAGVVEILLYVLPHSQRRISPFVIKIHKFASMGYAHIIGFVSCFPALWVCIIS